MEVLHRLICWGVEYRLESGQFHLIGIWDIVNFSQKLPFKREDPFILLMDNIGKILSKARKILYQEH